MYNIFLLASLFTSQGIQPSRFGRNFPGFAWESQPDLSLDT